MILPRRRQPEPIPDMPAPQRTDIREFEKAYARLFSTPDGRKVLAHLNATTFMRTAGADVPDNVLRHLEGQRALLATMLRMIERGKNP